LYGLSDPGAVYSEQVWADDQAAFAARRTGPEAGDESLGLGEAGHQDEIAFDGAFFCERDVVWFWSGAVEETLASADSEILDRCDPEY
jgi:hypothetical protein